MLLLEDENDSSNPAQQTDTRQDLFASTPIGLTEGVGAAPFCLPHKPKPRKTSGKNRPLPDIFHVGAPDDFDQPSAEAEGLRRQKMPVFSTRNTGKKQKPEEKPPPGFRRNRPRRRIRGGYQAGGLLLAETRGSHPAGLCAASRPDCWSHPADGGLWTFPVPSAGCPRHQIAGELLPLPTFIQPELPALPHDNPVRGICHRAAVICSKHYRRRIAGVAQVHANTDTLPAGAAGTLAGHLLHHQAGIFQCGQSRLWHQPLPVLPGGAVHPVVQPDWQGAGHPAHPEQLQAGVLRKLKARRRLFKGPQPAAEISRGLSMENTHCIPGNQPVPLQLFGPSYSGDHAEHMSRIRTYTFAGRRHHPSMLSYLFQQGRCRGCFHLHRHHVCQRAADLYHRRQPASVPDVRQAADSGRRNGIRLLCGGCLLPAPRRSCWMPRTSSVLRTSSCTVSNSLTRARDRLGHPGRCQRGVQHRRNAHRCFQ